MSSTPSTPALDRGFKQASSSPTTNTTPPSSPPSAAMSDGDLEHVDKAIIEEEKRLQQQAEREQAKEEERRKKSMKADKSQRNATHDALLELVRKSEIFSELMSKAMFKKEQQEEKKDEAEKKRAEKHEVKVEEVTISEQRRSTRTGAAQPDKPDDDLEKQGKKYKQLPNRGKKGKENGKSSISQYFRKQEQKPKGSDETLAVKHLAPEKDNIKAMGGAQDLHPADQPKTVTGGIMRGYQLEGLDWLTTLYNWGLNGILADEMGLGKTVQTIAFIAFLREQGFQAPYLIVAPLSTLSNWVDEFERWTPGIPVVLYHGSPAERKKLRDTRMKNEHSEKFPVVCTSYEICMNDRKFLSKYHWKYLIIDEGHRLKNLNCRLIKELKQYDSANRLLITGTPLQNNLLELWSLLNFLLPTIFNDVESFEEMFDFSAVLEKGGNVDIIEQQEQKLLRQKLHGILQPFLLRRIKTDVETNLPKKREYILYAPLTAPQKELYRQICEGTIREYLEQQAEDRVRADFGEPQSNIGFGRKRKADSSISTPNKSTKSSRSSTPADSIRSGRKARARKSYKEVSDQQYFRELQESDSSEGIDEAADHEASLTHALSAARKEIANLKLQNPIMQLRQVCNHPHLLYPPSFTSSPATLISSSGKLLLLDRLLPHLFALSHKVLIFSQFTHQLDLLATYAAHRAWPACRIDGSVAQADRRQQIAAFNTDPSSKLFLLSTRAGGQGINLTAADTVVLFDSDWNPQQDLQAQDRAHRIGQERPVVVYRLATKGTVEQTLLEKADAKRRLEKLVIAKGKFRSLKDKGRKTSQGEGEDDDDDLEKILGRDDFEGFDMGEEGEGLLTEEDLRVLTDRSDEAYRRAERGEDAGEKFKTVETKVGKDVLGEMVK